MNLTNRYYLTEILGENAGKINEEVKEVMDNPSIIKDWIDKIIPMGLSFLIQLLGAVIFLIVGAKIIKTLVKMLVRTLEKGNVEKGVATFLGSLLRYVLYFVLIMMILAQFGVTTGSVVAVLGSAGLTIGLALQGSLANFAGGVLILVLKPFVVGDYIMADGIEGTVDSITIFYTNLITVDNHFVVVPNGTLSNCNITNISHLETRRIDIKVGVDYSSNLSLVKKVLYEVASTEEAVLKEENIDVFVAELAESSVDMELRVWVKNEDYWPTKWRLTEAVRNALDENGIQIPYPHIHLLSDKN